MGNKVYWDCPRCGDSVWTYGGWGKGTKCWNCRVKESNKKYYKCPKCKQTVWVHKIASGFVYGQICFNCRR